MATTTTVDGPTALGGDRQVVYYLDDAGANVEEDVATRYVTEHYRGEELVGHSHGFTARGLAAT